MRLEVDFYNLGLYSDMFVSLPWTATGFLTLPQAKANFIPYWTYMDIIMVAPTFHLWEMMLVTLV